MPDETQVTPQPAAEPAKGQTYSRLDTYRAALRPTLAYLAGGAMLGLPIVAVCAKWVAFEAGMTVLASVGGPILGFYFQVRNQQTQGGAS